MSSPPWARRLKTLKSAIASWPTTRSSAALASTAEGASECLVIHVAWVRLLIFSRLLLCENFEAHGVTSE